MPDTLQNTDQENEIAKRVQEVAASAGDPSVIQTAFNGQAGLQATLQEAARVDRAFRYPVSGRDSTDVFRADDPDTIEKYSKLCVEYWSLDHRPSLPAIAQAEINRIHGTAVDGEQDDPHMQALQNATYLIAARGEMIKGQVPDDTVKARDMNAYHNAVHTGHVALMANILSEKNNLMAADGQAAFALTDEERVLVLLAAFAHDIDHGGGGNPKDDIYHFEEQTYNVVQPLMAACGVSEAHQEQMHMILRTTSPQGPQTFLKQAAKIYQNGDTPTADAVDPDGEFPELHAMLDDPRLVQMCAIISDADLFASAGAGKDANYVQSIKLSREMKEAAGQDIDFTTDQAFKGFANFVVGDGFASYAGQALGNDRFYDLLTQAERNIERAAAQDAAAPSSLPAPS